MNTVFTRILIGFIGAPLILFIIYLGNRYFLAFLTIVAMISQFEFYRMARHDKKCQTYTFHGIVFGLLWLASAYWAPEYFYHALIVPTFFFLILNLRGEVEAVMKKYAVTLAGFLYIPVLLSTLVLLRQFNYYTIISNREAYLLVISIFVGVWLNDTFAYTVGMLFGKHRLAPKISPKKSIEGSIAGIVGAFLTVFVMFYLNLLPGFFTPFHLVIYSLILGIFPQLGDLSESMLKRDTGVKDSGTILLGHGGVLDRFDAIFLTAPAVYLFIDISLKLIK